MPGRAHGSLIIDQVPSIVNRHSHSFKIRGRSTGAKGRKKVRSSSFRVTAEVAAVEEEQESQWLQEKLHEKRLEGAPE